MCLLVANPKNKSIPLDVFKQATASNPDGFGISFVRKGRVVIQKFAELAPQAQFDLVSKIGNVSLLHWRFATSGAVCSKLAHPFRLSEHMSMAHNGVLPLSFTIADGLSDTATLVAQLSRNPAAAVAELRKHDFKGNKFAVLTTKKVHIVGEEQGTWEDDVWYSNQTGFESRYKKMWGGWKGYDQAFGGSFTTEGGKTATSRLTYKYAKQEQAARTSVYDDDSYEADWDNDDMDCGPFDEVDSSDIKGIYKRAQLLSEDLAWELDSKGLNSADRVELQDLADALDTFLYGSN